MPVRISQPPEFPGGRVLVRVDGAPAINPSALNIAIRRGEGPEERYLDPRVPKNPWSPSKFDFPPINPVATGGAVLFELDHSVTYHMTANMTFVLRLVDGDAGSAHEERAVWTGVRRLRSELPEGWTPPPAPVQATPEPQATLAPPPPEAVIVEPEDRIRPTESPAEPSARTGINPLIWVGLALALLIAGGVGWWLTREATPDQPTPSAETPSTPATPPATVDLSVDGARKFLTGTPDPGLSFQRAKEFQAAKSLDGAFLLYRYAAQNGNVPAALAVGAMYDPASHSAETSPLPAPNATEASNWYRIAAEKGDSEGQFRLGRVLMSGKTDEPDGPEKGVVWLRRAAEQGHSDAAAALPK